MLLATVEHSGTFRTLGFLNRKVCPLEEEGLATEGSILFAHLYPKMMPLIRDAAKRMPVWTTSRPESAIRASWASRGRDTADLEDQLSNYRELLGMRPYILTLGTP